jgi:hypothetical protein
MARRCKTRKLAKADQILDRQEGQLCAESRHTDGRAGFSEADALPVD